MTNDFRPQFQWWLCNQLFVQVYFIKIVTEFGAKMALRSSASHSRMAFSVRTRTTNIGAFGITQKYICP